MQLIRNGIFMTNKPKFVEDLIIKVNKSIILLQKSAIGKINNNILPSFYTNSTYYLNEDIEKGIQNLIKKCRSEI